MGPTGGRSRLAGGTTRALPGTPPVPSRPLIRPTLALAVAVNRAVRLDDEWFDEPDDLERLQRALRAIDDLDDPVAAAAVIAFRVARTQAFGEGNKRTAFLLARWVLDSNAQDASALLPPDDRAFADLLVRAAAGSDVQEEIIQLLRSRRG